MDKVECVVVGAGVVGLAVRAGAGARRARGGGARARGADRQPHQLAQFRGDPRRHLLPEGLGEGAALRARPRAALRLLRRRAACRTRGSARSSWRPSRARPARSPASPPRRAATASTTCAARRAPTSPRLEPELRGVAGLLSPSTGIVDSHALMLSYLGEAEDHGGDDRLRHPARRRRARAAAGLEIAAESGGETLRLRDPAAGQRRRALRRRGRRRRSRGWRRAHRRQVHYCKGSYFGVAAPGAVPPPDLPGARARRPRRAPDARHGRPRRASARTPNGSRRSTTASTPRRADGFYAAIRRYWPGLPDGALAPDYTGIRPKLHPGRRPGHRLRHRGPGDPRAARPRQPLRHREPRPDRLARHRRGGAGARRHRPGPRDPGTLHSPPEGHRPGRLNPGASPRFPSGRAPATGTSS